MEKYKSREVVYAEQYFDGKEIEGVKIGKNDIHNRWDDTPNGAYIQGEQYKYKIHNSDWVIRKEGEKFLSVLSDKNFNLQYKIKN